MTEVVVEAIGETVGEAKWAALRELERLHPGLDRNAVRFEVVSEGERGLLGVGYAPARVMAADEATRLRVFLERAASAMGVTCTVVVEESDAAIVATLGGSDLGLLIGHHGQ